MGVISVAIINLDAASYYRTRRIVDYLQFDFTYFRREFDQPDGWVGTSRL